jgi:hypothetical protein
MMSMLNLIAELDLGNFKPPSEAFAPDIGPTDTTAFGVPLVKFLSNFIGFLTTLAGILFLIYFIFAGLSWVTSGGDKGKVETARNQMTQAALGLIVVIAGYGITGVIGRVLGLDILNPVDILKTLNPLGP